MSAGAVGNVELFVSKPPFCSRGLDDETRGAFLVWADEHIPYTDTEDTGVTVKARNAAYSAWIAATARARRERQ